MTDLDDAWVAAAADAGVGRGSVTLYSVEGGDERYGAALWAAGRAPTTHDNSFAFTPGDIDALWALRDEDVIVVARGTSPRALPLVLRHEGEHVVQERFAPAVGEFSRRLSMGCPAEFIYHAMPHERDADAAATRFAGTRGMIASGDELEGDDRYLFAAPWDAPDPETLPLRLVAFSLLYPDAFDLACRAAQVAPTCDPDTLYEEVLPGSAAVRRALAVEFTDVIASILDHGISLEEWSAMARPERNVRMSGWRAALVEAERRAVVRMRQAILEA